MVENSTTNPITIRYHHHDYDYWSGFFPVSPNKATRLAREHWIQDINEFRVQDGDREYKFSGRALAGLRTACDSTTMARRFKLAPDCYLIYLGNDRLRASSTEPDHIIFEQGDNDRSPRGTDIRTRNVVEPKS